MILLAPADHGWLGDRSHYHVQYQLPHVHEYRNDKLDRTDVSCPLRSSANFKSQVEAAEADLEEPDCCMNDCCIGKGSSYDIIRE